MFNSVMDMFRGGKPSQEVQQTQQQQQQTQQQQTTNGLPVQQPNPAQTEPQVPAANVSPLDSFKDLWQNNPEAAKNSAPSFDPATQFQLDPAKLRETTAQVDFAKNIPAQDLQAIAQGGEAAVAALGNILNTSLREALNTSLMASAGMMQQGFTQAIPAMDSRITKQVTARQVSSQLQELNPMLNHPAAAPILEAVKERLIQQNPNASSREIADMAVEFVNNFASVAQKPQSQQAAGQNAPAGTDWDKFYKG